jgi:hypothetical protein
MNEYDGALRFMAWVLMTTMALCLSLGVLIGWVW